MKLEVSAIQKRFGGLVALRDVTFTAEEGKITSIIGPNGAGKTTLINLISGVLSPDGGSIRLGGAEITGLTPHETAERGIARTYQTPQMFHDMSVMESVLVGAHRFGRIGFLGAALTPWRAWREDDALADRAVAALRRAGLSERLWSADAEALAYGDRRRLEIARALAMEARLILLDEPAAGLNGTETREIAELVEEIAERGTTIVLVEHDMPMVMSISDHIAVVNFGVCIVEGAPELIRNDPKVIEAYLGGDDFDLAGAAVSVNEGGSR